MTSHAQVRSTTQRRGSTSKVWALARLTTSFLILWVRQWRANARLNPASDHSLRSRLDLGAARSMQLHPPAFVGHAGGHHDDRDEQAEGVDDPEGLAAGDPLAAVEAPGLAAYRRRALDCAGVHDPGRRLGVAALALADQAAEPVDDAFPSAVAGPSQVVAMHVFQFGYRSGNARH